MTVQTAGAPAPALTLSVGATSAAKVIELRKASREYGTDPAVHALVL